MIGFIQHVLCDSSGSTTVDFLDRLLGHDEWTTAECLRRCRELTPEQLLQEFDIGWRTLHATLVHMISNVGTWTELMTTGVVTGGPDGWEEGGIASLDEQHRATYAAFAHLARSIRDDGRENDTWVDILDCPPQTKTYGGGIMHVITHNMHHRSEVLHITSRLGLTDLPEGDLLSWEARSVSNVPAINAE
jgi:uncharacterized damage-inducible protein DinB